MRNNVTVLKDYKLGLRRQHFVKQQSLYTKPRCELFEITKEKEVLVETHISMDKGVSAMFMLQNLAFSIDSSVITKVIFFPVSLGCKVISRHIKTRLAKQVISLTKKVIV